jgi:hypothetical protein
LLCAPRSSNTGTLICFNVADRSSRKPAQVSRIAAGNASGRHFPSTHS